MANKSLGMSTNCTAKYECYYLPRQLRLQGIRVTTTSSTLCISPKSTCHHGERCKRCEAQVFGLPFLLPSTASDASFLGIVVGCVAFLFNARLGAITEKIMLCIHTHTSFDLLV